MHIGPTYLVLMLGIVGYLLYDLIRSSNRLRQELDSQKILFEEFIEHVNQKGLEIEERKQDLIQNFAGMANFEFKFPEDDAQFEMEMERSRAILESHGLNKIRLRQFDHHEVMSGRFK